MSHFSLKALFPLLVVLLLFLIGGVFFAATGVIEPFQMGTTAQSGAQPDSLAQAQVAGLNSAGQAIAMGPALSETEVAGEALFKGNCAQCHAINEVVVGPALMGLDKRRSERWLLSWIKNSGRMVASGDEYAIKIFNQYGQQQMPSFQLSESEIRQILAYVKSHKASGAEYNGAVAVVK